MIGTMGQLPDGAVTLIETEADAAKLAPADPEALGFVTQTTLSVEDTAGIIRALQDRFPALHAPAAESICYATTNRQEAVKETAAGADLYLIVGAPNSSNSRRLVESRNAPAPRCRFSCSALLKFRGMTSPASRRSACRPARRRRKSSSTKSSMPSASASM
ncbi:hypothetical protein AJ88_09330 [Mesorhizobium amorphae CCBAU 01583]|nr:hypothetical protein AJ88_09330 [Mesorhizobium amorphae CCBAU 01583]